MANILFNTITLNPNFQWKLFYKNLLFPILYIPFVILTRGIMGLYSIFSLLSIIFILFYGFKLIFKDSITSIFYIICITIIISFIPINYQSIISYITFSLVISIIVLKFNNFI